MALLSGLLSCCAASSVQVSDQLEASKVIKSPPKEEKSKSISSSKVPKGAPIMVSYFPVNSYPSRL
ncbi:hypothetical protein HN51_044938 [Arachis hypogaea]